MISSLQPTPPVQLQGKTPWTQAPVFQQATSSPSANLIDIATTSVVKKLEQRARAEEQHKYLQELLAEKYRICKMNQDQALVGLPKPDMLPHCLKYLEQGGFIDVK